MFTNTNPYFKKLDNGLVMKSVSSMEDVDRLVVFNELVFPDEESVGRLIKTLILNHPNTVPDYFIFIEVESEKRIVSSLCLIPWIWRFENVEIKSGEMGAVGTLKEYRDKGLIRKLNERFVEMLKRDNFDTTHIQGISFFYKQFGYEYAIPLEMWYRLDLHLIPNTLSSEQQILSFRKAIVEDIPTLMSLYNQIIEELDIKSIRNEEIWHFLLSPALKFDPTMEIWIILDKTENIKGYFRITQEGFGKGLIVTEVSNLTYNMARAVIKKLKGLSIKHNKPYLRFNIYENSVLVETALSMGANTFDHYAWQIYFVDLKKFVKKISPVLEQRIKDSPFAGLTENFIINTYRETLELRFVKGEIKEVNLMRTSDINHINIPPNLIIPFILGYRTREDLLQYNHDFLYEKKWEFLIDVLFPKMKSFIYPIY